VTVGGPPPVAWALPLRQTEVITDDLIGQIRREIAETAGDTSERARAERAKAQEALATAERLRSEMHRLLEDAHAGLLSIRRQLETTEARYARESRGRSDALRQRAREAQQSSDEARTQADSARVRSNAAVDRMEERERRTT
jgi:hypothetical protein